MSEFDVEPIPGLPALLPEGEELLWQGVPYWGALAKRAFHVRAVLVYFGILILLRFVFILADGDGLRLAVESALWLGFLGSVAAGILSLLGWLYARSTIYSITSRRVVIRSGVVVPVAVNLPFKSIESVGLRVYKDGSGDIPLALIPQQKVNYLMVWPNVRPWHFSRVQPMLRALPEVESVAELLAEALRAAGDLEPSGTDGEPQQIESQQVESSTTVSVEKSEHQSETKPLAASTAP